MSVVVPSSPEDKKKIRQALQEISDSLTRMEAERDLIEDILQTVEDNYKIKKKYTRRLAKVFHKQNFNQVQRDQQDLETLYESVTK